ncbi:MAG: opioid growth factor receptor-related protein [Parachlamydiaceae bacterium]
MYIKTHLNISGFCEFYDFKPSFRSLARRDSLILKVAAPIFVVLALRFGCLLYRMFCCEQENPVLTIKDERKNHQFDRKKVKKNDEDIQAVLISPANNSVGFECSDEHPLSPPSLTEVLCTSPVADQEMLPDETLFFDFYTNKGADKEGRMLHDIWKWNNDELESFHNYIQWLFPLKEASKFNRDAITLTPQLIDQLKKSPVFLKNMEQSFDRMMQFYGFVYDQESGSVKRGKDFFDRAEEWCHKKNHNMLRMTRILKSLNIFNLNGRASGLFKALEEIVNDPHLQSLKMGPSEATFKIWQKAAMIKNIERRPKNDSVTI